MDLVNYKIVSLVVILSLLFLKALHFSKTSPILFHLDIHTNTVICNMTFLFGNLTFLVEKDFGSGKNVGLGKDDGTVIERSKLDFFGVSSPILLFLLKDKHL